jgi:hypothetical protein
VRLTQGVREMSNGTTGNNGTPVPNGDNKLDIQVLNNGVKLLGEAVVPGASLLLEKHIGAGLLMSGLGVLGAAALGTTFGPLGYILTRYGASAVSYSQSLKEPPPPPDSSKKVVEAVGQALRENTEVLRDMRTAASMGAVPPAFAAMNRGAGMFTAAQPAGGVFAAAQPAAGTVDVTGDVLRLLRGISDRLDKVDGRLSSVEQSIEAAQPAAEGRSTGRRSKDA